MTPNEDTRPPAVVLERTVDAPPEQVWRMWTEPERFRTWYGPDGATVPSAEIDLRPGGRRHVGMRFETPDGPMEMWFTGEHTEVDPPRRLAYTESMADADGNVLSGIEAGLPEDHPTVTEVIVELEDLGDGRTGLRLTHVGVPPDSPGATGWAMALAKLVDHLDG